MEEIKSILNEIREQAKEFRTNYERNEQAVRTQLIEPVLNVIGWKTSNPKFVKPNAPDEDGKIPDYTLLKDGTPTLIVEAKNLSVDLQNKNIIDQLANYCFKSGIDFGVLTNGVKWLLFKTFEKNPKERIVWQVDIEKDKIEYIARNLSSFAYSNIDALDTLLKKSKLLDNGWKTLIESTDSIVTIISQELLRKIKSTEPTFKIDFNELKLFTKGKIEEIFGLDNPIKLSDPKESPGVAVTVKKPVVKNEKIYRFFEQFLSLCNQRTQLFNKISPPQGHQSWISATAGKGGLSWVIQILRRTVKIDFFLPASSQGINRNRFEYLHSRKGEIEKQFGEPLEWNFKDDRKQQYVGTYVSFGGLDDEDQWPAIQNDLVDRLIRFESAIKPFLQDI